MCDHRFQLVSDIAALRHQMRIAEAHRTRAVNVVSVDGFVLCWERTKTLRQQYIKSGIVLVSIYLYREHLIYSVRRSLRTSHIK